MPLTDYILTLTDLLPPLWRGDFLYILSYDLYHLLVMIHVKKM